MCGLLGALSFDEAFRITPDYLTAMRDEMAHRGPDGAGTWVADDGRVGLAHRRLAIIDLSDSASQPMRSADGRYWLTYNGEIYNHAELRAELTALGHDDWRTDHSDTEVILRAFATWGIDCLQRFRGMFAFAVWDARERCLWLVRDRIGVKPLYYSLHHRRCVFASEIKALLRDPDQPRALNEEALLHYLAFVATPAPHTLFDGIAKLPPATWLRIDADGRIEQRRYWNLWDHRRDLAGASDAELEAAVMSELRAAVALRKVSDVPVGVFLSGGIDSSLNATLFSEGDAGPPINTFSIGYEGENASYPNELKYARQVAGRLNATHHEKILTDGDLLDLLPHMAWLQDEPLADPVCVPVYYVSKLARDNGVIVCQVGEGADELFLGYTAWHKFLREAEWLRRVPSFAQRLGAAALGDTTIAQRATYDRLARSARGQPTFWCGAFGFTERHAHGVLAPDVRRRIDGAQPWDAIAPIHREYVDNAWEDDPANWMSYVDLRFRLPELLLMRVDKMSMGVGLEARVPFLDHKFVELAMSIPAARKFAIGEPKRLLKRAARDLLPAEILHRPKQGFGVPIPEWTMQRLGQHARAVLTDFCKRSGLFDERAVQALFRDQRSSHIWQLLNFVEWTKAYRVV